VTAYDPAQHGRQIQQHLEQQQWTLAMSELRRWLEHFPRHAPGWYSLATCLARTGEHEQALACARKAQQLDPANAKAAKLVAKLEASTRSRPRERQVARPVGEEAGGRTAAPEQTLVEPESSASGTDMATLVDAATDRPKAPEPTLMEQTSRHPHGDETLIDDHIERGSAPASRRIEHSEEASIASAEATLVDPATPGESSPGPTLVENDTRSDPSTFLDGQSEPESEDNGTRVPATMQESRQVPGIGAPGRDRATSQTSSRELWQPDTLIEGRYYVRGKARGGMGEVYFVLDRELGLEVAVKTPLPAALATEAGRVRFFREAEAWIALGLHPNICTAYYVRTIGGLPRLFIEYIDAGSLEQWLRANPAAEISQRLDLAIQVACGMLHAHSFVWHDEQDQQRCGLVHRDLKPANILIGSDGLARVTDFGLVGRGGESEPRSASKPEESVGADHQQLGLDLATLVDPLGAPTTTGQVWSTMTMGGAVMGTPPYMAPEQWRGAHLASTAADIYAFGCIMYELVVAQRPFQLGEQYRNAAPDVGRMIWERMHCEQQPPDPRELQPGCDDELAELMRACLAKAEDDRPSSFAVIASQLRSVYTRMCGQAYHRHEPQPAQLRADSLNNRGVSFANLGQLQRAERAWRQALDEDPQHPQAGCNLALFEWRFRGLSDQGVRDRISELQKTHQNDWRYHLLAGSVELFLGYPHPALDHLKRALQLSEGAAAAQRAYAFTMLAQTWQDPQASPWQKLAGLEQALSEAGGEDPSLLTCFALVNAQRGNAATSARLWQRAREQLGSEAPESLEDGARLLLAGTQRVRQLTAFAGRLSCCALTNNGRVGVTGGDDGLVNVWDLQTGGLVHNLRTGPGRIRCVAMVDTQGSVLVAGDQDAVAVFNLTTGVMERSLQVHTGKLNALIATKDSSRAVGIGSAGVLTVWDLASGKRQLAIKAHEGYSASIAVTNDGALAATGGGDGTVKVYDLERQHCLLNLKPHKQVVTALAFSTDGHMLFCGSQSGEIVELDCRRRALSRRLSGHRGVIAVLKAHADGKRLLSASADETLRVWDLTQGTPMVAHALTGGAQAGAATEDLGCVLIAHQTHLSQLNLAQPPSYGPAWAVSVVVSATQADKRSAQFKELITTAQQQLQSRQYEQARATVEQAREVRGYERSTEVLALNHELGCLFPHTGLVGAWEEHVLSPEGGGVTAMAGDMRGDRLLIATRERELILWGALHKEQLGQQQGSSVVSAAVFLDGDRAVIADLDNILTVIELSEFRVEQQFPGHEARVHALAVDHAGRTLVSASADTTLGVWDPLRGVCRSRLRGHGGQVTAVAVSPDGRWVFSGGDDGTLLVWGLDDDAVVGTLQGHTKRVGHVVVSLDGKLLCSASDDGTVRVWDLDRARALRTLDIGVGKPRQVALSSDNRFVLIGESTGRVGLYEVRSRQLVREFAGHTDAITAVSFSPDSRFARSASSDGTVRCWYLEWEIQLRQAADWDESARSYLEGFLARQTPVGGARAGRPEWSEADVQLLLSQLRHCGLGWLNEAGVREQLEQMTRDWAGPTQPLQHVSGQDRHHTHRNPLQAQQRRKLVKRALLVGVAAIPLLLLANFFWQRSQLSFDADGIKRLRRRDTQVMGIAAKLVAPSTCDPGQLDRYLRDFIEYSDNPGRWMTANYCIAKLGDPRAVAPLLDAVRPQPVESTTNDLGIDLDRTQVFRQLRKAQTGGVGTKGTIASLLARLGDRGTDELARAARQDDDPDVRSIACYALALRASDASRAALIELLAHPSDEVRRSASTRLATLVTSGKLDVADGFALVKRSIKDSDAEVRLNAVRALAAYKGRSARRLARQLADDEDAKVREAAASLLQS